MPKAPSAHGYDWFSEIFDNADRMDAKALLDELKKAQLEMALRAA